MTTETFRSLLKAQHFKPFRIVMSSGQSYVVRHPEMAMLTKSDMLVGIDTEEGLPANSSISSLLHITAVEPVESHTSK